MGSSHRGGRETYSDEELSTRLLDVPIGHHYLVLYSDLQRLRNVYSRYIKSQTETHPNSVIALLPFYETTDKVREILELNGINAREKESQGSLIIVDINTVIQKSYPKNSDTEKLRAFTKEIEGKAGDKTIFVIADMSIFNHLKRSSELLEYERTLHKDLKVEKWKELCFYNERDFDTMFGKEQIEELLNYHKDRVITI